MFRRSEARRLFVGAVAALQFLMSHAAEIRAEVAPMSKLYAGFLVIASMLALSAFGFLGLVVATRLINFLP